MSPSQFPIKKSAWTGFPESCRGGKKSIGKRLAEGSKKLQTPLDERIHRLSRVDQAVTIKPKRFCNCLGAAREVMLRPVMKTLGAMRLKT